MLQRALEPARFRCKTWRGDLERQCLRINNRARQALSLLLVPAKDGDKQGTPVVAEKLFDQMEIYPGMRLRLDRSPTETITETGSKKTHFRKLHEATGIPYSEMVSSGNGSSANLTTKPTAFL